MDDLGRLTICLVFLPESLKLMNQVKSKLGSLPCTLDRYLPQLKIMWFLLTTSIHFHLWQSDWTGLAIRLMPGMQVWQSPIRPVSIDWKNFIFYFFPYKLYSWIETLHLWKTDRMWKWKGSSWPNVSSSWTWYLLNLVSGNSIMSLAKSTCFAQSMHWYRAN